MIIFTTKWRRDLIVLFFIIGAIGYSSAQTELGPKKVIKALSDELTLSRSQNEDSLEVYARYLKQLVDRGNFLQVDSVLIPISRELSTLELSPTLASIYTSRAYMYKVQRRYPKALEDYLRLKTYYENSNQVRALAEVYCLLAEYYRAIGNYNLCKVHLDEAQKLFKEFNPGPDLLAYWYSRKAAWSNESLHNRDSVLYYAKEGLRILEPTDNVHTRALMLNEIGFSVMSIGLTQDSVLSYFNRSKDLLYANERFRDYVEVVNNMGMYHYRFGNWPEAIGLLESILPIQEENKWFGSLQVTYDYLTGLYRDTDQTERFYDSREKSLLTNIANIQTINEIQVNDLAWDYEKDISEKELKIQEQRTEVAEQQAASNRRAFVIALVVAIALLILVIISFQISIRFRRKNEQLDQQRKEIEEANQNLEQSLEQQRVLFKELNHRVKNNLSILTGLIYLQEVGEEDTAFQNTLGTLRGRIKSMALAHENLYNSEKVEKIFFQSYLEELFAELRNALSDADKINVIIDCQDFELELQQAVPLAMIVNELFTNSIKHGFKDKHQGEIHIKVFQDGQDSVIEYSDNGIGLNAPKNEKGNLGLRLIRLLLEQLEASLIDQSLESGVIFVIRIPARKRVNKSSAN